MSVLEEKLMDMDIPGYAVELTPEEADTLGFCIDDALTLDEALDASLDNIDD